MTDTLISLEALPRLGIGTIDAEHEAIVQRVNELHEGMLAGQGRGVLGETLEKLIAQARAHFATEEALMVEHDYADCAKHKSEHDRLLAHIIDLERQFQDGQLLLSFAIMLDVKNWATIHIERSDTPLGKFLRERGVT